MSESRYEKVKAMTRHVEDSVVKAVINAGFDVTNADISYRNMFPQTIDVYVTIKLAEVPK